MEGDEPGPVRPRAAPPARRPLSGPSPEDLLRALDRRADSLGIPPPAALLGDWLGGRAVLVPSVALEPTVDGRVFDRLGRIRLGVLSYPDEVPGDAPLLPAALTGTADGALVLDHGGRWRVLGEAPAPAELMARWGTEPPPAPAPPPLWNPPDRATHLGAIDECLEAIAAGEIYQACLSTRLDGRLRASPLETFLGLRRTAPARRSAYLTGPHGTVLCFSPEDHLVRRGDTVTSSPIKGTVPASADPRSLRRSAKDVAENIMIVDLVRHDLGQVAEIGSVVVTELLAVRPAPGVHHLVSTVRARVRVGHDELVAATFPPASVTGTPKLRARDLIRSWEPRSRGLHCGVIGLAVDDRLETAVAIRTMEAAPDGTVELGVGGGITSDSVPAAEWQECLDKAAFAWGGGPPPR